MKRFLVLVLSLVIGSFLYAAGAQQTNTVDTKANLAASQKIDIPESKEVTGNYF